MLTVKDGKNESSVPLFFYCREEKHVSYHSEKSLWIFFLITMNESSLRTDIYDHQNVIKTVTEIFMVYNYVSLYIAMKINIIRM